MQKIKLYKFYRRKYGTDFRFDATTLDYIRDGLIRFPIHRESFYCIILVKRGVEKLSVGGISAEVSERYIISGLPGDIWEWEPNTDLKGEVVIFEPDFIQTAFVDTLFLERFGFLNSKKRNPFIKLASEKFDRVSDLISMAQEEMKSQIRDIVMIRALLVQLLVEIEREYKRCNGGNEVSFTASRYIVEFINLVNREMFKHHDIGYYANRLCITPNYLSKISRQNLGVSSQRYIQDRLISEAKNILEKTQLSIAEIATALGFESQSYFSRFFKKFAGRTPVEYRLIKVSGQTSM